MIVTVFQKRGGTYQGFSVSGHAEYDEVGLDICCAAVSSAVQTVANAITEVFVVNADVDVKENRIALKLGQPDDNASRLIAALHMQMQLLADEFPENIEIRLSEV